MPIYDSGRKIMGHWMGHLALQYEMKCSARKHLAPYALEKVELQREGLKLDAGGTLYVSLTEYKAVDPAPPSLLSVGTPGDKRSLSVERRFKDALERDQVETGEGESLDETLS